MRARTRGLRSVAALLVTSVLLLAPPHPLGAADAAQLSGTATASVANSTLHWGQSTTVRGGGWKAGTPVNVTLSGGTRLASVTAAADGSITATITAPSNVPSSNRYILAVDGLGADGLNGYVQMQLTIVGPTPTISVASTQLHWNEVTTVSGQRYQAGTEVTISLFPDAIVLAKVVVGSGNSFAAPVRIPSGLRTSKDFYIVVTGEGSDQIFHFDSIQTTIIGDRPTASLSSSNVPRGGSVTVSGRLFLKGTTATITLLPGFEKLGKVTVGNDSTFSVAVKVPDLAGGIDPHAILVTGQGQDALFAYLPLRLNLGGTAPAGPGSNDSASDVLSGKTPPPSIDPTLGATPGTLDAAPVLPNAAKRNYLVILLLLALLVAAIVVLLALTARRDVRVRLRRWWDHQRLRIRARRGGP